VRKKQVTCRKQVDNQLNRRNISPEQRTYLIGKRYKEEKKEEGRPKFSPKLPHSEEDIVNISTGEAIGKQSKVGHATVERAEKFAEAVDTIAENTGIDPQKILSGSWFDFNGLFVSPVLFEGL
jgi:hypothetical protein